jgi:hypothetical protein
MTSTDTSRPILFKVTITKKGYLIKFRINKIKKIIQFKKCKEVYNSQSNYLNKNKIGKVSLKINKAKKTI